VVGGEAKRVEVLVHRYYWKEIIVVFEVGKSGFDELACDGEGMVFLEV
jgi:hypothetical protein